MRCLAHGTHFSIANMCICDDFCSRGDVPSCVYVSRDIRRTGLWPVGLNSMCFLVFSTNKESGLDEGARGQ